MIHFSENDTEDSQNTILPPQKTQSQSVKDVNFPECLTPEQLQTVESQCDSYRDVFTNIPGTTNLVKHKIELTSSDPIQLKQYPIPFNTESIIGEKVE